MTEKESIERCKQIVKDNNEIIKEARKNGDINTMNLTASLDNDSIAIKTVIQALEQKDKEIQELKKYDIRNIKIDKDKIISSPSFTRKEVDLMNLGIALSLNADKLFNDESEEDDI